MTFGNFALVTSIVLGNVIQYKFGANSFGELCGQFVKGAAEHGLTSIKRLMFGIVWSVPLVTAQYCSFLLVTLKFTGVCIKIHHPAALYSTD